MPDLTFLRPIQAMVLVHNVTPSQALRNLPFVGSWAYVMNGAYVSDISAMFSLEHEMLFTLLRHNTVSIVTSTVSLVTNIIIPNITHALSIQIQIQIHKNCCLFCLLYFSLCPWSDVVISEYIMSISRERCMRANKHSGSNKFTSPNHGGTFIYAQTKVQTK